MKIGYLVSDVDVEVLGSQGCSVHIREFTNALVDAGHDVFIVCSWPGGEGTGNSTRARIHHLGPTGLNKELWEGLENEPQIYDHYLERDLRSILWNHWLQAEGARIFREEKPDFVYERIALFGFGGLELRRQLDIPWILELNAPLTDQQDGYTYFPLIETARKLEGAILREADAIVALTDWLADWAVGLGAERDRIRVLPDGVSKRLFGGEIDRGKVREVLGENEAEIVGFVGSFHKWHDVAGLIEAFATLEQGTGDRRLLLVGDGHTREKLEQQVARLGLTESVHFTGKVPHEEIPSYLAAMNVAVVPYGPIDDFFFSPMKLFESMAVGTPTVAADLGQISQVVEHGRNGWLYPAGDNQKLAEGISVLLDDSDLAGRIGTAAREEVLARYTWERVTAEVVILANKLSEERHRA